MRSGSDVPVPRVASGPVAPVVEPEVLGHPGEHRLSAGHTERATLDEVDLRIDDDERRLASCTEVGRPGHMHRSIIAWSTPDEPGASAPPGRTLR